MIRRLVLYSFVLLFCGGWRLSANTITLIEYSGLPPSIIHSGGIISYSDYSYVQWVAMSWTQSSAYYNVEIALGLADSFQPEFFMGTAYLTSQLGLGTTEALHEVARSNVSFLTGVYPNIPFVPVLSGLSLGPGDYYLMLTAHGGFGTGWWFGHQTVEMAQGISFNGGYWTSSTAAGPNLLYPPASEFLNNGPYYFRVTGTEIPEPAAGCTVGIGLLLLGVCYRLNQRRALRGHLQASTQTPLPR